MKRRLFIGVGGLAIVAVAGVGLLSWANQPSVATVIDASSASNDVKGTSTTIKDFSGNTFSTKITSDFKVKTKNESEASSIIGQYLLIGKDAYSSDQLAITVGTSRSANPEDVSPVKFRSSYPDEYTRTVADAEYPEGSIVFTKKSSYEKSVFWLHNGQYVAVVVSGGVDHKVKLEGAINVVVANWQWL